MWGVELIGGEKGLKGIFQGGAGAVVPSACSCRRHHTTGLVLAWWRQAGEPWRVGCALLCAPKFMPALVLGGEMQNLS